jgi:hypothetical protein
MGLPEPEELEEFSTGFDMENVRPFLNRLPPLILSGFGAGQIDQVCALAESLRHDEERELQFPIQFLGKKTVLRIRIFLDDIDAPDLYFLAPAALSTKIGEEFEKFAEELGI